MGSMDPSLGVEGPALGTPPPETIHPHLPEGEAMSKFDHLRGMVDGQRKWGNTHVPISLETLTELLDIVEARPDKARFRTIVDEALNPSWVDGTEYSIGHPDELADVIYQAMAPEGELSNGSQE